MYYIGIDLGTTGCKAIVFSNEKGVLGDEYVEYPLIVRSQREVEQDANLWWDLVCRVVKASVEKSGVDPAQIESLSLSTQGLSFVLVDRELNTLGNAITWLDTRPVEETEYILTKFTEDKVFGMTGKRVTDVYVLPKLMWVKKHMPEEWAKAYKVLMPVDFLTAKMTGNCITDHTLASGTMMYDIHTQTWSDELIDTFDIEKDKLPEIAFAGTVAGTLTQQAAEKMGLVTSVKVVIGGQDQKVAALFVQPDLTTATLSMGTAGAIEFLCDQPITDPDKKLPAFSFLVPERWTLEAVVSTTGACLKWFRNTLFAGEKFRQIDEWAMQAEAGCNGLMFYPHLSGASSPVWNSDLRGSFHGITLDTNKYDFCRSVLEGVAFQLRSNLLVFEKLCRKLTTINVFGGGSSPVWCQIIADITGKNVTVYPYPEVCSLGAAKLAYMGVHGGKEDGFGEGFLKDFTTYRPDADRHEIYKKVYEQYAALEEVLSKHA